VKGRSPIASYRSRDWIKKRKELRLIFQTVKPEENARRKEITLLLAADNIDDESQMDVALHGELAEKIVEQIFQQASKGQRRAISKLFSTSLLSKMKNYLTHKCVRFSGIRMIDDN
jgi:hypothetical protein